MQIIFKIITTSFIILTLSVANAKTDKITIGLDWFINPDHAPLIIAQKRGFFKEVGLEVEMIEPADPNDPPKLVAAGKLDLAISYQPQLHIQVDQGLPVVRVGTLVSVPLNSLVVLENGPIKSISDLKGKKIGFSVGGFEEALLSGMLEKYNIKMTDVDLININFSLSPSLIAKKVDAVIGAFRNFELNQMDIVNHPGKAFYPEEHGVPSYEELIYISNVKNRNNPVFDKFFKAIQKATLTIINDPETTWKDFSTYRKGLDDELNKRAFKDTLSRFTLRPQAHDLKTYEEFGNFLKEKGIIKKNIQAYTFAKP
ncbi:ABC transporter substrate-binding protein [Alphaproteobacteria bacterium]|jgi:putative hydroxymethylpyrimidine transport system substrate-binding protein|nr:ABC transporter substrate-binding protein [Alphaproteobacteria bacterium]MDB2388258.1 ABC transporter substrate-binding protein [Alphaproteobacteria bacterium]MDB2478609.1 ABC transporter substrate-binding protein [Alphaproteobacteria bacterium]MDB2683673.1 ABC transporter substrate-binding protein [Alphaproteobacteria bacterium]